MRLELPNESISDPIWRAVHAVRQFRRDVRPRGGENELRANPLIRHRVAKIGLSNGLGVSDVSATKRCKIDLFVASCVHSYRYQIVRGVVMHDLGAELTAELPLDGRDFLSQQMPPEYDSRHHVINFIQLVESVLQPIYDNIITTTGGNISFSRGQTVGAALGLDARTIAGLLGDATEPETGLYGFIVEEMRKGGLPSPTTLIILIDLALQNQNFETFGELVDLLSPSLGSGSTLVAIRAIADKVDSILATEIPCIRIPINEDPDAFPQREIWINGPFLVELPTRATDFLNVVSPGLGANSLTLNVRAIVLGPDVDIEMRVREREGGAWISRWQKVVGSFNALTITDLQLSAFIDDIETPDARNDGWDSHGFHSFDWREPRIVLSSGDIEADVRVGWVRGIGAVFGIVTGAGLIGQMLIQLGILGADRSAENMIEDRVRDALEDVNRTGALLELLGLSLPQSLLFGFGANRLRVARPYRDRGDDIDIDYPGPDGETRAGALRIYSIAPPPRSPSPVPLPPVPPDEFSRLPDLRDPPSREDPLPNDFRERDSGRWKPLLERVFEIIDGKGDFTSEKLNDFVGTAIDQLKDATRYQRLVTHLSFSGVGLEEMIELKEGDWDEKESRIAKHKLPPKAAAALSEWVAKGSGNPKSLLIVPAGWKFGRAVRALDKILTTMKHSISGSKMLATGHKFPRLPTPETQLEASFRCESGQTPLAGRMGSPENPGWVELASNCAVPTRILRSMRRIGRLNASGTTIVGTGEIGWQVDDIEDAVVGFHRGSFARFANSPTFVARGLRGSITREDGSVMPFNVVARLRVVPRYLDQGCLSDAAAKQVGARLRCIERMMGQSFDDQTIATEILFRRFVFLVAALGTVQERVHVVTGGFAENDQQRELEAGLADWVTGLLPVPLMYDPWHPTMVHQPTSESEFSSNGIRDGWIEMSRNYSVADI